jgi:hypothetical protein
MFVELFRPGDGARQRGWQQRAPEPMSAPVAAWSAGPSWKPARPSRRRAGRDQAFVWLLRDMTHVINGNGCGGSPARHAGWCGASGVACGAVGGGWVSLRGW